MDISLTDFMVHVDETLEPVEMDRLEDSLRTNACVVSACTSPRDPHLLLVAFNPECTSSGIILNQVKSQGVHAELVGL